jgi:hypothetical protein
VADFTIQTGADFHRVTKALKAAGRTELRKELNKRMKKAAKPLIPIARAEARATLPQSGGLADQVARAPMRVQVRTGTATAGVRVVVGKDRSGARAANRGLIRHPVFGNRERWVDQQVPKDWFDRPMRQSTPLIKPEVIKAIESVLEDIVREAKR